MAQKKTEIRVWQFARYEYYSPRYELHEIREIVHNGFFTLTVNICDQKGNGCPCLEKFETFEEAKKVLDRFRPGSRLISSPSK